MSIAYDRVSTYAYNNQLVEEEHREYFYSFKVIYRYVLFYSFTVFFICLVSITIPIILYAIMFSAFEAPKELASRLYEIRMARKK